MQLEEYAQKFIRETIRRNKVVIFSWTYPQSYQTRDLLTQIRVVFFEVEISREEYGCDISHFLTIKTGYDFPKIFIKGQHIAGFDELNNLYCSGELDKLLQ
ncbi:hypothetical protein RMATCC62417_04094 [Rhizopus microsporus]|nr:hypothetical protein RMATCC62417_04094 [Rhizopus microsporus]